MVAGIILLLAFVATNLVTKNQPVFTQAGIEPGDKMVLRARRTTRVTLQRDQMIPVYITRAQMMDDDMVYDADGGMSVTLSPGRPRLFRLTDAPGS